jgi:hypothetical protein
VATIMEMDVQQVAKQIESQRPGWMVLWGFYSKEYVAFPLFNDTRGTILSASYPPALLDRMQEFELRDRRAARQKAPGAG